MAIYEVTRCEVGRIVDDDDFRSWVCLECDAAQALTEALHTVPGDDTYRN